MAANPVYIVTPVSGGAQLSTADTSRTAPTVYATVFDPGATGGFCERINIVPTGTVVAGVVRFFKKHNTDFYPLFEVQISAFTASNTVEMFYQTLSATDSSRPDLLPIGLPIGWTLVASLSVNNPIFVATEGGAY